MVSQSTVPDTITLVRCGIGAATYGINMAWVREIGRADSLQESPGPDGRVGTIAHGEKRVPVFSPTTLRGFGPSDNPTMRHVIVLRGEPPTALLVDRVSQVFACPARDVRPLPQMALNPAAPYFEAVVQDRDQAFLLLSPGGLIPSFPTGAMIPGLSEDHRPRLEATAAMGTKEQRRLILFSVTNQPEGKRPVNVGLCLSQVLEVLGPPPLLSVPGGPEHLRGLAHWRDLPIPVIDLGRRLGLPGSADGALARLIIARASPREEPIGFLARAAVRTLGLPVPHVPSRRSFALDPTTVRAVVEIHNETLVVPDLKSLVASGA